MNTRRLGATMCHAALFAAMVFIPGQTVRALESGNDAGSLPILYTTDLYQPPDDPDDHFDLATLFAIKEFDIRGIVFDLGKRGAERPGLVALRQLTHLTGKNVDFALGLTDNLRSPDDQARWQPAASQGGVEFIIRALEKARRPVTVFTTGSLRDVAAAFNRDEPLFRKKVGRIYVNAGHSGGKREWNVDLDLRAYLRILRSGLNVYWVPCFGDDQGYASLWSFRHEEVLDAVRPALQRYFVYAITKASPDAQDPIAALSSPIPDDVKAKLWPQERKMWCTAAFLHAAGRQEKFFSFKPVTVHVDDTGVTRLARDRTGVQLMVFHRENQERYAAAMRQRLRDLLAGLGTDR